MLAVERDTPCTSILLAVEMDTPFSSILLAVERDTTCTSILLHGGRKGYTLDVHIDGCCWCYSCYKMLEKSYVNAGMS
jgi:hypothetical protein